ncbi:MAG: rhodanese-like domain-containing protein [Candidatus Accumulibacter sp.]|jgi:rhodanese-related sulfurtransferase|nr:rhodanese-like domain-containing protein [Accumulibacter sp.]
MEKLSELLSAARKRAKESKLPYSGALTPEEAHEVWRLMPGAKLVDVRTQAEWDWVGRIPGSIEIEWMEYPGNALNPDFLRNFRQKVPMDALVMLLCRSGVRSHKAACLLSGSGYSECFNVLEGFEGNVDENGQRGRSGGWRKAGLPWKS